MGEIEGTVAIVSQASSHLAFGVANVLLAEGARLALVDTDLQAAKELAKRLDSNSGKVWVNSYTLSAKSVHITLESIKNDLGKPNILLNLPYPPVIYSSTQFPEDDFRNVMDHCLINTFLWCQAVGQEMLKSGSGVIVNITGLSGMGGWPGWLAHCAAFAGIHNLTHTLASEWTRFGVRVNTLVPGVDENIMAAIRKTPQAIDDEAVLKRIPLGRLITPQDLGKALLYLIRPAASFISGEILCVDGAWDVWGRYYAVDPSKVKEGV